MENRSSSTHQILALALCETIVSTLVCIVYLAIGSIRDIICKNVVDESFTVGTGNQHLAHV